MRHWRSLVLAIGCSAIMATVGCDRRPERTSDAALRAAIEKAQREQADADRQMRERAAENELARREAEQAEIDARVEDDQARKAVMVRLEQRLRDVLVEPSSMQIRNQHLSADGNTLCAEFSAKNKQGIYVGFRRVVVSDTVISYDQDPDDTYRDPQQRFAALAKATGCY